VTTGDWVVVGFFCAVFGGAIATFVTDVLKILVSPFKRRGAKELPAAKVREVEERSVQGTLIAMRAAMAKCHIEPVVIDLVAADTEAMLDRARAVPSSQPKP
jgi:hypothetical protein